MIRMNKRTLPTAVLVSLFISLTACKGENDQRGPESTLADSEQPSLSEQKILVAPMNLNTQVELSKKDLAQRLDVPPESVMLSGARQVTWRSGALGCPKPGMSYTEALVPGAQIFLQVDNMIHAYHAKFGGEPFYCPRERVEQPVSGEGADLI